MDTPTQESQPPTPGEARCSVISPDERAIIELTRENAALKLEAERRMSSDLSAEIAMSSVGVPKGFEDGNDWDAYSFHERIRVLCDMYKRVAASSPNV